MDRRRPDLRMDTVNHVSILGQSDPATTDSGCTAFRVRELERPSVEADADVDLPPLTCASEHVLE
jgi:hypothetical protein